MIATFAQTAGPAFRSAGALMGPVLREAGRDAMKHTAEAALISLGGVLISTTAVALYVVGSGTMNLVRLVPRPRVQITWDRTWDTDASATARPEPGVAAEPELAEGTHTIDGTADAVA